MKKRKASESSSTYEGGRNRDGLEHGRGTTVDADGTVFRGRFVDGVRQGKGTLIMPNSNDDDDDAGGGTAILSGVWQNGALEGDVTIQYVDGTSMHCKYVDGELDSNEPIRELDAHGRVTFEGYLIDEETKIGTVYDYRACSRTVGRHINDELSDDNGIYFYPDGSSLRGQFVDGLAVNAHFFKANDVDDDNTNTNNLSSSIESKKRRRNKRQATTTSTTTTTDVVTYRSDVSTATHIGDTPLRRDPYETTSVFVAPSSEPGGGEGLFARRALPAHSVVAYYAGVRITHRDEKRRDWRLNSNSISLNDTHVIDVPAPFDSTDRYCASLGHKGIWFWC